MQSISCSMGLRSLIQLGRVFLESGMPHTLMFSVFPWIHEIRKKYMDIIYDQVFWIRFRGEICWKTTLQRFFVSYIWDKRGLFSLWKPWTLLVEAPEAPDLHVLRNVETMTPYPIHLVKVDPVIGGEDDQPVEPPAALQKTPLWAHRSHPGVSWTLQGLPGA